MSHSSFYAEKITSEDLALIREHLGREPEGIEEVCSRDPKGVPLVIRVAPIVRERPFPNLYWLCHRPLSREIDRLEAAGLIKKLENEMSEDFYKFLEESHKLYRDKRMFYVHSLGEKISEGHLGTLQKTGVGGISDFRRIRCLHAHIAAYLAFDKENPVGNYLLTSHPNLKNYFASS